MKKTIRSLFTAAPKGDATFLSRFTMCSTALKGDATFLSRVTRGLTAAALSLATLLITTSAWAAGQQEQDEIGLSPSFWYKFDGNLNWSGARGFDTFNPGSTYTEGKGGKANAALIVANGQTVNETTQPQSSLSGNSLNTRPFTFMVTAKVAANGSNKVYLQMFAKKDHPDKIILAADPVNKKIQIYTNEANPTTVRVETTVDDMLTAFHTYVVTGDGSKVTLYVDGVAVGNFSSAYPSTTRTACGVFTNGGDGMNSGFAAATGTAVDDYRIYCNTCLTADQVSAIFNYRESLAYVWDPIDNNWSELGNWLVGGCPATELPTQFDTVSFATRSACTITIPSAGVAVKAITMRNDGTVLEGGPVTLVGNGAGSTIMGEATFVFDGSLPDASVETALQSADWKGTVWLKNKTGLGNLDFTKYGNANTTIRCTGISGNFTGNREFAGTLELENGSAAYGLNIHDGASGDGNVVTFDKLTGSGKLLADGGSTAGFLVKDWDGFTGDVELNNKAVTFGDTPKANVNKIIVNPGFAYVLAGQTWTANGGIQIDGTIGGTGVLASAVTFGLNATLDATGSALLTANALPTFALTNRFALSSAPVSGTSVKVLNVNNASLKPKALDVVPVVIVGGAEVDGIFRVKTLADGVYLDWVSGKFQTESAEAKVSASALNAQLAGADGDSIVTITLTGENPVLELDVPVVGGDVKIVHEGNLTIKAASEPENFAKYDLRGVTGLVRCSWLTMTRVINLNFASGYGKFTDGDMSQDELLAGNTPKASWVNLEGGNHTDVAVAKLWNVGTFEEEAVDGMKVSYVGGNYGYNNDIPVLNGYLDESGDVGNQIVLSGVPFEMYDLIVYLNNDKSDTIPFHPVHINGVAYTWDAESSSTVVGADTSYWGSRLTTGAIYGRNALHIADLSGENNVTITTGKRNDTTCRGAISAIQIVEVEKKDFRSSFTAEEGADVRISELNAHIAEGLEYTGPFTLNLKGGDLIYDADFVCVGLTVNSTGDLRLVEGEGYALSEAEFAKIMPDQVSGKFTLVDLTFVLPSAPSAGKTYRWEGTTTLAVIPYANLSYAGTIELACPVAALSEDSDLIAGNGKTIVFDDGFSVVSANRVAFGNPNPGAQTIIQKGGTLVFDREGDGEGNGGNGNTPLLINHWNNARVDYTITGGSVTATNGAVVLGWDSTAYVTLGGDETKAPVFTAKGINGSSRGNEARFTVSVNGVLEIGSYGIVLNGNKHLVLAGGELAAYDSFEIRSGAVEVTADSTVNVPAGMVLTIASPLTGDATLTKTGAGRLVVTGSLADFTGMISVAEGAYDIGAVRDLEELTYLSLNGGSLAATANAGDDGIVQVVNVPESVGVVIFDTDGVTPLATKTEGTTVSAACTIKVDGSVCLFDWTFTNTVASVGQNKSSLYWDTGYDAENGFVATDAFTYGAALNTKATPYSDFGITYPAEWTCVIAGIVPSIENAALIAFGTQGAGCIALVAGSNDSEVKIVRTTGNSAYAELAAMKVPNARTASHTYAFVKTTEAITVYLDGKLWNSTPVAGATFGNQLQVGSLHGGQGSTSIKSSKDDSAGYTSIQAVRIFNVVLGPNSIRAFADEFPYVSPSGLFTRTMGASGTWAQDEAWKKEPGTEMVSVPDNGSVAKIATGVSDTTLQLNLDANRNLEELEIRGTGKLTFESAEGFAGKVVNDGATTIAAPVVIKYGSLDISGGPTAVENGGSIVFDLSDFTDSAFMREEFIPLTGIAEQTSAISFDNVPAGTMGRVVTAGYDPSRNCFGITISIHRQPGRLYVQDTAVLTASTVYGDEDGEPTLNFYDDDTIVAPVGEAALLVMPDSKLLVRTPIAAQNGSILQLAFDSTVQQSNYAYPTTVIVEEGGVFDLAGHKDYSHPIVLAGGTLKNSGVEMGENTRQYWQMSVISSSTIDVSGNMFGSVNSGKGSHNYVLNGNTITKTGSGEYYIANAKFDSGRFVVNEGSLVLDGYTILADQSLTIEVAAGATLRLTNAAGKGITKNGRLNIVNNGGTVDIQASVTVDDLLGAGTMTVADNQTITINGTADYPIIPTSAKIGDGAKIRLATGQNQLKDVPLSCLGAVTLDAVDGAKFTGKGVIVRTAGEPEVTSAFAAVLKAADRMFETVLDDEGIVVEIKSIPRFVIMLK